MKLFRTKKSFWERHRFKIFLVLIVVLGGFAWVVLNRVDQLEVEPLDKLRSRPPVTLVEALRPQAPVPEMPTEAPLTKEAPELPPAAAPQVTQATAVAPQVPQAPAGAPEMAAEVRSALMRWSRAWAAQDVMTYLSMYGTQFVPPESKTRAQWESDRRQRILGKKKIQHIVNKLEVSVDGEKATTKFEQVYVADRLQLNQNKVIAWQRFEGRWLIVSETVAP